MCPSREGWRYAWSWASRMCCTATHVGESSWSIVTKKVRLCSNILYDLCFVTFSLDTYSGFPCTLLKPRPQKILTQMETEEQEHLLNAVAELALSANMEKEGGPEGEERKGVENDESYSKFVSSFVNDLAWRNML